LKVLGNMKTFIFISDFFVTQVHLAWLSFCESGIFLVVIFHGDVLFLPSSSSDFLFLWWIPVLTAKGFIVLWYKIWIFKKIIYPPSIIKTRSLFKGFLVCFFRTSSVNIINLLFWLMFISVGLSLTKSWIFKSFKRD